MMPQSAGGGHKSALVQVLEFAVRAAVHLHVRPHGAARSTSADPLKLHSRAADASACCLSATRANTSQTALPTCMHAGQLQEDLRLHAAVCLRRQGMHTYDTVTNSLLLLKRRVADRHRSRWHVMC